jgi:hypothetical protein
MLTDQELRVLDGFRFEYRMPSRAAAIRELLKRGLATGGDSAPEGVRSIHFSVIESKQPSHAVRPEDKRLTLALIVLWAKSRHLYLTTPIGPDLDFIAFLSALVAACSSASGVGQTY